MDSSAHINQLSVAKDTLSSRMDYKSFYKFQVASGLIEKDNRGKGKDTAVHDLQAKPWLSSSEKQLLGEPYVPGPSIQPLP